MFTMAEPALQTVKPWIDYSKDQYLTAVFVSEHVRRGVDTVAKFMAVTYFSQFKDLDGEFSHKPVFLPDFHLGYVLYSSTLIKLINDVHYRGFLYLPSPQAEMSINEATTHPSDEPYLIEKGAQLGRLYLANKQDSL